MYALFAYKPTQSCRISHLLLFHLLATVLGRNKPTQKMFLFSLSVHNGHRPPSTSMYMVFIHKQTHQMQLIHLVFNDWLSHSPQILVIFWMICIIVMNYLYFFVYVLVINMGRFDCKVAHCQWLDITSWNKEVEQY